jgi:hypothetical protein
MGSGTYIGTVTDIQHWWNNTLTVTLASPGAWGEPERYDIVSDLLIDKFQRRVQVGDRVELEVEFEHYTVTGWTLVDLDSRALLARIVQLEKIVKDLESGVDDE